ncbi:MAG: T9SS type A sorting domain-containing protein [Bacteroidota bacterium]
MKKIILLLVIIYLQSSTHLLACDCLVTTTFCETVSQLDPNIESNVFVLRVKITEEKNDGVDAKVQKVLFGELSDTEIFVRSGNGANCGVETSLFSEGEEYIFVLGFSPTFSSFSLHLCHVSYLKIEDEIIKGAIASGVSSLPYEDLSTLTSCGSGLDFFVLKDALTIFPNPTTDMIRIKNSSNIESSSRLRLEMVDVLGQDLGFSQKEDGIQVGEEWIINVEKLATGVYFFKITSREQKEVFKIVKR